LRTGHDQIAGSRNRKHRAKAVRNCVGQNIAESEMGLHGSMIIAVWTIVGDGYSAGEEG
jgi:hypothetical protein